MIRKCKNPNCNNDVKGCQTCEGKIHTWKNVCCSHECYRIYITLVLEGRNKK